MANYIFFVSANPLALILIASTFTGIEISHQIFIVLFGLTKMLVRGTKIQWKIGPMLKILLKTIANSAKLNAFSDSMTSIYPKNDLKFRVF